MAPRSLLGKQAATNGHVNQKLVYSATNGSSNKENGHGKLTERPNGLFQQKRPLEHKPEGPSNQRRRLLSERGEEAQKHPILDRAVISHWKWTSQNRIGRFPRGAGLVNHRNDCFMNSCLQIVVHTAPLARFVHDHVAIFQTGCPSPCLLCMLKRQVTESFNSSHAIRNQMMNASRWVCRRCQHESNGYERMRVLELGMDKWKQTSVKELIARFFRTEQLNDYKCEKCAFRGAYSRTAQLLRPPAVLVLLIQRFSVLRKVHERVFMDHELDLESQLVDWGQDRDIHGPARYRLRGIIEHHGCTIGSGHYQAYHTDVTGQQWFSFDDEIVGRASEADIQILKKSMARPLAVPGQRKNGQMINFNPKPYVPEVAEKNREIPEIPRLCGGSQLDTEKHSYIVAGSLGCGSFGEVWLVRDRKSQELVAMKVEHMGRTGNAMRLHNEVQILQDCNKQPAARRKHFLRFIDLGRSNKLFRRFLVMELASLSLAKIRMLGLSATADKFSPSTALQVAKQLLQGIWDLHDVGYIHRDLKLENAAVGFGDREKIVYLLDFGIGRRWCEKEKGPDGKHIHRRERKYAKQIGTRRYLSRNCLQDKDQSRRDDVEIWLYVFLDLYRGLTGRVEPGLAGWKVEMFSSDPEGWPYGFPKEFHLICVWIDALQYADQPPYQRIMDHVDHVAAVYKLDMNEKLDWEGKITDEHRYGAIKKTVEEEAERRRKAEEEKGLIEEEKRRSEEEKRRIQEENKRVNDSEPTEPDELEKRRKDRLKDEFG
ncbi:unnamed protein product, partial [Mesorhabditis spiculigera]